MKMRPSATARIVEISHFRIAPGISLGALLRLAEGRVGALARCCGFGAYRLGRSNGDEYVEIVEWDEPPCGNTIEADVRTRAFRAAQRPSNGALGEAVELVYEFRAF